MQAGQYACMHSLSGVTAAAARPESTSDEADMHTEDQHEPQSLACPWPALGMTALDASCVRMLQSTWVQVPLARVA